MKPEAPKERDIKGGAKDDNVFLDIIIGIALVVLFLWLLFHTKPVNASEHCMQWSDAAEGVMLQRQENVPMELLRERLNSTKDVPEAAKPTMGKLITAVYNVPVYDKIKDKLQVIEDFSKAVFIDCLKETAKDL